MRSSLSRAVLALGITPLLLAGCVTEKPYIPIENVTPATTTAVTDNQTAEISATITVTDGTDISEETTVFSPEYTEPTEIPEPELSSDSFKIKTNSTDLNRIAEEVLTHIYSKSEKNSSFDINDIRYMAKGRVEEHLWFAISYAVQTDKDSSRLEALIQQDSGNEYSLITINTKVPIDNLTDDDNCPPPANADLAEILSKFQGTNLLTESWNSESESLPSANNLVIFAEKNIGEKATYTIEEICDEIQKFMPVSAEYLQTSNFYNQTTCSFSLIENPNIWKYAFVSSEPANGVIKLKIMGIRGDDSLFSREILLTISGSSEQYQLISCETVSRETPPSETPYTISHNEILLGENVVSLDLIMTDGQYIESVSGKNIFRQGYRGKYEFVISRDETELLRQQVNFPELELLNFRQPFKLAFSDYDKDGNFEFSLGQWQNGKMFYQFYSIDNEGNITLLPVSGEPVITDSAEYSKAFAGTENGFSADVFSAESETFHTVNYTVSPENITSITE